MVVRSKDLAPTEAQAESRRRRAAMKKASELREQLAGKRWDDLSPGERNELLKAMAIHFGFISAD